MTNYIPVIDIAAFLEGDLAGKAIVAQKVARAAQTIGFIIVSGHKIPQSAFDEVLPIL